MTNPQTEIATLRAELADLRALVESVPIIQTRIAERRMIAKEARLRAVGTLEPPEALAELAEMSDGDRMRCLELIGCDASARILRPAPAKITTQYLAITSRALRDQVRAQLVPDDQIPRHVWIEAQARLGRFGEAIKIPKKIATQLVQARVGSLDDQQRYVTPAMAMRARWPVHIFEMLRGVWPLLDEGIATDSIRVTPCTLDEDRALLAAG